MLEFLKSVADLFLHLDRHLGQLIQDFGPWTYLILFLVVFCETGLVVTPFLPGDSLLFALGVFCANGALDLGWTLALLTLAAILGDTVNYAIGAKVGPAVFREGRGRFFKREHLERTHAFYERHGGKTIILARFMPIIRTFAPFVAGIGRMDYPKFLAYNVIGAVVWVAGFLLLGFYFGNIPVVKRNFTLVILVIVVLSVLPGVVEYLRHRRSSKKGDAPGGP
jgi:membrane-associated protein